MTISRSPAPVLAAGRPTPRAALAAAGLVAVLAVAGCGTTTGGTATTAGGPASPAVSSGADAQVLPVDTNPIDTTATGTGLVIDSVLVENNVDPTTGAAADDHLEVALSTTGTTALTGLELFYTFTDTVDGATESYYVALPADVTVMPGQATVVDVDSSGSKGHVPANAYSLYYTSPNAIDVEVVVAADGMAPQQMTVTKDAGGAETAD